MTTPSIPQKEVLAYIKVLQDKGSCIQCEFGLDGHEHSE